MPERSPADRAARPLADVYEGWTLYNNALLEVIDNSTDEFLKTADGESLRSPADILRHVALGRIEWLARLGAPGFVELRERLEGVRTLPDGGVYVDQDAIPLERSVLRQWLMDSADALRKTLGEWTTDDLDRTIRHHYQGTDYALRAQWVLFRIAIHDFHHGGQLSLLCQQHGVDAPSLVWLGGHLTPPPVWNDNDDKNAGSGDG